jgi:hypothetical protein
MTVSQREQFEARRIDKAQYNCKIEILFKFFSLGPLSNRCDYWRCSKIQKYEKTNVSLDLVLLNL